jgi:large conductance mechanosensitive channel
MNGGCMPLVKEFKSFAMRGNVVDMAVGIIIGAAFGKIISSLVNDILMPPIGVLVGGMDFSSLSVTVKEAVADHAAVVIKYGMFINILIDFLIVAFAMFMIIQAMNRLVKKPEAVSVNPTTKECPECLMVIPVYAKRCGHCTAVLK